MTKPALQHNMDDLESEQRARAELEGRLRRARAEFQEFTSRVSHDLREPLRTVSVYSQLLLSKAGAADEEATLYLNYIHDAVDRAETLLAAMIEYATIQAEPVRPVAVDMNGVYREVLRRIAPPDTVRLTSDPLPQVSGDFELLAKVLRHLIENAIKFAGRPDPTVHLSARQDADDNWIISVRDNGPGIDPAHHEKIFGLFRRLHGREYPGAGLGLAFSRGAIELLGGRIWVESSPGNGSVFSFTLPPAN